MSITKKVKEIAGQLAAEAGFAEPKAHPQVPAPRIPSVELVEEPRPPRLKSDAGKSPY